MEDLKSLMIGIIGGLIVIGMSKLYKAYRKKSILEDIEFLEYEKRHLEEMKRSSVEMNRSSFRSVFALFLLIGIANLAQIVFSLINVEVLAGLFDFLTLAIWATFVGLCIKLWRRYDNLKNYNEAIAIMNERLVKLQRRIHNS